MNKEEYFETIKEYKLLAKHEVGQNFLIDPDVCEKIVSCLEAKEGEQILEIGSGAGSLSYFLSLGPAHAKLIDIDEGLVTKLQKDFQDNPFVEPSLGNAMRYDYASFDKIIGNLPYYITTGLIETALLEAKKATRMVFMIQKEAANRLLAKPKEEDYTPFTIYLNYVAKVRRAFNVNRTCFSPAPHVDSTVLALDINQDTHNEEAIKMYHFAQKMFLNRRKTILNNLKAVVGDKAGEILEEAKIKITARPEELSAADYLRLLTIVNKRG